MTRKYFGMLLICALCVVVHFSFVEDARASDGSDLLAQRIRPTAIKGESLEQALDTLTSSYGIPIGIEFGDPKLIAQRKIDLNLPETNVREFLDSLIEKVPQYTWKLEGGVIHVRPSKGRDELLTALLDTKISNFAFSEGATRYAIFSDLLRVPEIQTRLIVADVVPLFIQIGFMQKVGKGISFEESNLTLGELLDRMILHQTLGFSALGR